MIKYVKTFEVVYKVQIIFYFATFRSEHIKIIYAYITNAYEYLSLNHWLTSNHRPDKDTNKANKEFFISIICSTKNAIVF